MEVAYVLRVRLWLSPLPKDCIVQIEICPAERPRVRRLAGPVACPGCRPLLFRRFRELPPPLALLIAALEIVGARSRPLLRRYSQVRPPAPTLPCPLAGLPLPIVRLRSRPPRGDLLQTLLNHSTRLRVIPTLVAVYRRVAFLVHHLDVAESRLLGRWSRPRKARRSEPFCAGLPRRSPEGTTIPNATPLAQYLPILRGCLGVREQRTLGRFPAR